MSESSQNAVVVNTLDVRLCLVISASTALNVAMKSYAWERRQLGALSYSVIRDELDATFFRLVLFFIDVAGVLIAPLLASAFIGAIVGSLLSGHLDRLQTLAYTATLVTTTASTVSVFAAEIHVHKDVVIPWLLIAYFTIQGILTDVGGPVRQASDGNSHVDTRTDPDTEESVDGSVDIQAYQSPGRGRVLTVLGWALMALLLLMGLILGPLYEELVTESDLPLWTHPLIAFAVVVALLLLIGVAVALLEWGKRHRHRIIPSFEELAGERYLLYLRPFTIDPAMALPPDEAPGWYTRSPFELPGTHEEFLVRQFRSLGRIVAVGQPGEHLPALGAERGYLPVDNWKDTVSELIQGAHAVIMTAAPGPGTAWEFTEALRAIAPTRLLLLVYYDEIYHPFREGVRQEYARRSSVETDANWPPLPQLPDIPPPDPHTRGLPWDFPLKGILSFDHQWHPQFTRFPPTVPRIRHAWTIRRLVRRELKPVLYPVSQLPPTPPLA